MDFSESEYVEVVNYTSSSVIAAVHYHGPQRSMLVEFKRGRTYEYSNVPEDLVRRFAQAEGRSLGRFFQDEVRDKYVATLYN